jgi:hypothetical protein
MEKSDKVGLRILTPSPQVLELNFPGLVFCNSDTPPTRHGTSYCPHMTLSGYDTDIVKHLVERQNLPGKSRQTVNVTFDFKSRELTVHYRDIDPGGRARQFQFVNYTRRRVVRVLAQQPIVKRPPNV